MSTLTYLDNDGKVSYSFVPWKLINDWLSSLNSNGKIGTEPPKGVNRGKIIGELEERRIKSGKGITERLVRGVARVDRGYGKDWCDYENDNGYTHLEELIIFQPAEWRNQAREYVYQFHFDVRRRSLNPIRIIDWTVQIEKFKYKIPILMEFPILVALFHPEMKRSTRYEPINFLLAYDISDPLPLLYNYIHFIITSHVKDSSPKALSDFKKKMKTDALSVIIAARKHVKPNQLSTAIVEKLRQDLSPFDYFFQFQEKVQSYALDILDNIGQSTGVPRLWLMKELDFSLVIGQRAAKHIIREEVVTHFWNRSNNKDEMCSNFDQPLSMIFAGPSGNGKTELAVYLSKLLNKPEEDAFHKVDCGKLTDGRELFGMSGAFHGSEEGSSLNNFICRMSTESESIGVVLLDEIEKARSSVIHGLYQVLDKGEWTNKRLEAGRAHTQVIPCRNIIFIMTTNAADRLIDQVVTKYKDVYTSNMDDLEDTIDEMSFKVQQKLQDTRPFTEAFLGRIGKVVPFLPMATDDKEENLLLQEMTTVAKLLIDREEEKITEGRKDFHMEVDISPEEKDKMAHIIVKRSHQKTGVRGIQKLVREKVSKKLMHRCVLNKGQGRIGNGSKITFSADRQKNCITFREDVNSPHNVTSDLAYDVMQDDFFEGFSLTSSE